MSSDCCLTNRRAVPQTTEYGDPFVFDECAACGSLRIDGGFVAEASILESDRAVRSR